jgi:hypothetical protein
MNLNKVQVEFIIKKGNYNYLVFNINLKSKPSFFRSFKYSWEKTDDIQISGPLSPKIIKFDDGTYLMANRYIGTWVYDPENPLILKWIIVSKETQPFFKYDDNGGREWLNVGIEFIEDISINVFETKEPFELSFSKIPFKPVVIFTDHCDFDSDILLKKQREFFKEMGICISKGFFLKKHSHKGIWNSAFEGNEQEYKKWLNEGHELCYHSLSQSKIPNNGNEDLFNSFTNPFLEKIETWIDHGYQSYNLSKSNTDRIRKNRLEKLLQKGIKNIWNYNDVGEVVDNMNQLDFRQITISRVFSSKIRWIDKLRIIYFFNSTENEIIVYRKLAELVKERKILNFAKYITTFLIGFNKLFLKPVDLKEKIKRSQVTFCTEVTGIIGFQTIVVKDWVNAFGIPYARLKRESGIAVLHSYFSFLGKHHVNTLFTDELGNMNENVRNSFMKLKKDIVKSEIWNPTLHEFVLFINELETIDISSKTLENFGKRRVY